MLRDGENTDTRVARCCCGKSALSVTGEPALHAVCHCDNCKQRTGSAFGVSAYFRHRDVNITKDSTQIYQVNNALGEQQRHFCSHCGTTLYWYVEAFKGLIGVAAGCFTEHPLPAPNHSTMTQNQCTWVVLADGVNAPLTPKDIPTP